MKWFKHEGDAQMNLKLQSVIENFGLEGYGYYWACLELVAKEGNNYLVNSDKDWKLYFKKFLNIEIEKQEKILSFFSEKNLIDKNELINGNLYIPKLEERSDEYTKKLRRISGQTPSNVLLEQNRIDKNRIEQNNTVTQSVTLSSLKAKRVRNTKPKRNPNEPISLPAEIKLLEDDPQRYKNIIALYLEHRKPDLRTWGQLEETIDRHSKPAAKLKKFADDQIIRGFKKAKAQTEEWTLETALKALTK